MKSNLAGTPNRRLTNTKYYLMFFGEARLVYIDDEKVKSDVTINLEEVEFHA